MLRGLMAALALFMLSLFLAPFAFSMPVPAQSQGACGSDDPNHLCLALKVVAFRDASGEPVLNRADAEKAVQTVNSIWNRCNIGFTLEKFEAVKPEKIRYQIGNYSELTDIRNQFDEDDELLVAATGAWDRTGSLGKTSANAWTSMPGGAPYGAVIERPVAHNGNLIAHELGHYLNLLHARDNADIMNAIIYTSSVKLTAEQCSTARAAVTQYWSSMVR